MPLTLTDAQIAEVRYRTHRPALEEAMRRHDAARFRTLGPGALEQFLRHGWDTAQELRLLYVNDVAYLLFLMTFLGERFLDDFRFAAIAEPLRDAAADGLDTRVRRAREAFLDHGEAFIGKAGAQYLADVARFRRRLDEGGEDPAQVLDALCACHEGRSVTLSPEQAARLRGEAAASAAALGLDGEAGLALALALRWWLGLGFHDAALYPWVREVGADAPPGPERARVLRAFALKRLGAQLRE